MLLYKTFNRICLTKLFSITNGTRDTIVSNYFEFDLQVHGN